MLYITIGSYIPIGYYTLQGLCLGVILKMGFDSGTFGINLETCFFL
jgi:hypothetical protein